MKLFAIITSVFFLFSSSAIFAQPRYSPEVRAKREVQWMHDSLALQPEKTKKAYDICFSYNAEMDKISKNDAKDKQKMLLRKKNDRMKAVLSKEQYLQYLKWEKEQAALEKQREKNGKGPHRAL